MINLTYLTCCLPFVYSSLCLFAIIMTITETSSTTQQKSRHSVCRLLSRIATADTQFFGWKDMRRHIPLPITNQKMQFIYILHSRANQGHLLFTNSTKSHAAKVYTHPMPWSQLSVVSANCQYDVCPPLFSMTSRRRLRIDSTNLAQNSGGMASHSKHVAWGSSRDPSPTSQLMGTNCHPAGLCTSGSS